MSVPGDPGNLPAHAVPVQPGLRRSAVGPAGLCADHGGDHSDRRAQPSPSPRSACSSWSLPRSYAFFKLLNVAILALTALIGLRFLTSGMRALNEHVVIE